MKKGQIRQLGIILLVVIVAIIFLVPSTVNTVLVKTKVSGLLFEPIRAKQLQWNGLNLTDSTVYDSTNNICTASRYGMQVVISPCKAQTVTGTNIVQNVVFNYTGATRNISWVFVYDSDLESGSIGILTNLSRTRTVTVIQNTFVSNYLVDNVVSYVNLTLAPPSCDLGNLNNTRYYNVTRTNSTNPNYVQTVCFSTITVVNATAFRISGNADLPQDIQYTDYYMDYVDHTNDIIKSHGLLADSRSYYLTESRQWQSGETFDTKWVYTPVNRNKSGKWHIIGYDTSVGLINSIESGQYLYVDPWWDSNWAMKQQINVTGGSILLSNFTVFIPINYTADFSFVDMHDIRFTDGTETVELPYEFDNVLNSTSVGTWVKIPTLNAGEKNTSIWMYYKNNLAGYGEQPRNAWDSSLIVGYHLPGLRDSVGLHNLTVLIPPMLQVVGAYGNATYLNGSSVNINLRAYDATNYFALSSNFTVIYNVNTSTVDTAWTDSWSTTQAFSGGVNARNCITSAYCGGNNNKLNSMAGYFDASLTARKNMQLAMKQNASKLYAYYDGVRQSTTFNPASYAGDNLTMGRTDSAGSVGVWDDFRIYSADFPDPWIARDSQNSNYSKLEYSAAITNTPLDANYPIFYSESTTGNASTYSPLTNYAFQIRVNSTNGTTGIEFDGKNYSMANSTANTYQAIISGQRAGVFTYYYWAYGNGTNNNYNRTQATGYTILKDSSTVITYLGSTEGNNNLRLGKTMNFTGNLTKGTFVSLNMTADGVQLNYSATTNLTHVYTATGSPRAVVINTSYPGNENYSTSSEAWSLSINNDVPELSNAVDSPTSPVIYSPNAIYQFNITIADAGDNIDTVKLQFNGTNYTARNVGSVYNVTLRDLGVGNYSIIWTANDSNNDFNKTTVRYYSINQSITSLSISVLPSTFIYNGTTSNVEASGCPTQITCNLYKNGSLISNPEVTANGVGNYTFVYNTTGNGNYTSASVTAYLNVTNVGDDVPKYSNLVVSPASPQTYSPSTKYQFNSTWVDLGGNESMTVFLEVNGVNYTTTNISNVYSVTFDTLSPGTYNYHWIAQDQGSNTNSTANDSYIINKANSNLTLSMLPSNNVNYNTTTNLTASSCPAQLTCSLVKNGLTITSPEVTILDAGTYRYNYSTAGNENYTASFSSVNLTVNKINASLTITINPLGIVINGTSVSITGTGCPAEAQSQGACVLLVDGAGPKDNPYYFTPSVGLHNVSYWQQVATTNYNDYSINTSFQVVPVPYGGTNGTLNFTAQNLSYILNFQVPLNFTTHAYMNLSGSGLPFYSYCYQANTSLATSCRSSIYNKDKYSLGAGTNSSVYDGDWNTYGEIPFTSNAYALEGGGFRINATLPLNGSIYGNLWEVKTENGTYNITIDSNCFNPNNLTLYVDKNLHASIEYVQFGCYANPENPVGAGTYTLYEFPIPDFYVYKIYETALIWNVTNTYENLSNVNISINKNQIFYYSGIFNQSNNKTNNFYNQLNSYLFNCVYTNGICAVPINFTSSTPGRLDYSATTFDNVGFIENSQTFDTNAVETALKTFSMNISYDRTTYTMNPTLYYNGTAYVGTSTNTSMFDVNISRTIVVPLVPGNKSFYWQIELTNSSGSFLYNSTTQYQNVSILNMSICRAAPYNIPFLNYTFHNETLAGEAIKANFQTTFTYWLSNPSVNKTYSFTNASVNSNYAFCFTPSDVTINVSATGSYSNSYSQERQFTNSSMVLTNATTTQDLLLLPNVNGIYITFIVQNSYGARISGALVDVKKTSGNVPVSQAYTDGTGSAAFFLDTTTSYTITISKSGYVTTSTGITPTSSPVTIILSSSGGGGGSTPSPREGVTIAISPTNSILKNGTTYDFVYDINSGSRTFDGYGFSLWNATDQLIPEQIGDEPHGEELIYPFNTGNQTYIKMYYYYIIGGNYTNLTHVWAVQSVDGTDFSIAHAIGTFNKYTDSNSSGIFGVKRGTSDGDFTFAFVIFFITLFAAGAMTYKYGITSMTATMFAIFSLLLFFDVGAGWIPNPLPNSIPHFVTVLAGLTTIGFFIKEMLT